MVSQEHTEAALEMLTKMGADINLTESEIEESIKFLIEEELAVAEIDNAGNQTFALTDKGRQQADELTKALLVGSPDEFFNHPLFEERGFKREFTWKYSV